MGISNKLVLFPIALLLFLLDSFQVEAQQDALITQFAFNKMVLNPAYTGSRGATSFTALYRHQWLGFQGAPRTTSISLQSPLKNRKLALGFFLVDDRLDVSFATSIMGDFAYRIPVGKAQLSFGLEAGVIYQRLQLSTLGGVQPDNPLLMADQSNWSPDFGAGIYFSSPKYFLGISSKSILENQVEFPGLASSSWNNKRQLYAMMGFLIGNSQAVKFRPSALFNYVANEQLQVDINGSFLFVERFWLGASYRSSVDLSDINSYAQSAVSANIEYYINMQMRMGYSYDYLLSALSTTSSGSHEVMFGFDFAFKRKNILSPRVLSHRNF